MNDDNETKKEETIVPEQQIMYFRLVTGDELVGSCLGEDPDHTMVVIKQPMILSEIINPVTQSISITLSKYMIFSNYEVIPIKNVHIVSMTRVIPELEEFYHSSVIFSNEISSKEVAKELARANRVTKGTTNTFVVDEYEISEEDEFLLDFIDDEDDDITEISVSRILPSNTTIH